MLDNEFEHTVWKLGNDFIINEKDAVADYKDRHEVIEAFKVWLDLWAEDHTGRPPSGTHERN